MHQPVQVGDGKSDQCSVGVYDRGVFAAQVLGIGGGAAVPAQDQFHAQILHNKHIITYNQMITLVDVSVVGYQTGLANLIDIARQSSNAARLDALTELTLKALESRATSTPPPKFNKSRHFNLRNFIQTEYTYWYISQGLNEYTAVRHLPLVFESALLRDHIHDLVKKNSDKNLSDVTDVIITDTALESESTYATQQKFTNFEIDSAKSLADNSMALHLLRKAGWPEEGEEGRLDQVKSNLVRKLRSHFH